MTACRTRHSSLLSNTAYVGVCEGSHSSRRKVTDITRRTVYLIQSGRNPPLSCRFPDGSVPGRLSHVLSRRCCSSRPGRERAITSGWRRRKGRNNAVLVPGCDLSLAEVINWAPITFAHIDDRVRGSGIPALRLPESPIRRLFCVPANRRSCHANGRSHIADAACSGLLTEKSVSTGRSLDNECCVNHTVVYLIRYAIL